MDSVEVTCVYDATDQGTTVRWADGTNDEMCLATFYTVAGRPE